MIQASKSSKPKKPRPDFPLYAHASGKWAKKIHGQVYYFGEWADPYGALDEYRAVCDDLYAGRTPQANSDGLTLGQLVEGYLKFKRDACNNGEITERTFEDYQAVCCRLEESIKPNRRVGELRPADFTKLRKKLYEGRGHKSVLNDITRIKMVFAWGYEEELLDRPMRYGKGFKKPSAKTMRLDRERRGPKDFEAEEILALLDIANPKLRAMILLGINCAYGNHDVAELQNVSIKGDWIDYPRPKTGMKRRCNLWPETLEALDAIRDRTSIRVFETKRGNSFVGVGRDNPISKEFAKLQRKLGISRKGRGFYGLRHTMQTQGEVADFSACKLIMGHVADSNDMSAQYRERIEDDRIKRVTDHVRQWLFAPVVEALVGCFGCAGGND